MGLCNCEQISERFFARKTVLPIMVRPDPPAWPSHDRDPSPQGGGRWWPDASVTMIMVKVVEGDPHALVQVIMVMAGD